MSSPADPDPGPGSSPGKEAGRGGSLWVGMGFAVVFTAIAVLAGPGVWHDLRENRRVARDPHVKGRVLGLLDTGEDHRQEPLMEVSVEFTTLDGRALRAKTIERVDARDVVRLLSHREIDVWYDVNDPADIVIRWRPR